VRMPNSSGRIWLGSYESPRQAARAYDCAVFCLRGHKAKFNFLDFLPEIPSASSLSPAQIKAVAARFAREEIPVKKEIVFCGSETQSLIDGHQIVEEQLDLDSLLQDLHDFPSLNFEDIDLIFSVENRGGT
ncbi:hypothetical protein KI387_043655, partial [Taxus chinensis]